MTSWFAQSSCQSSSCQGRFRHDTISQLQRRFRRLKRGPRGQRRINQGLSIRRRQPIRPKRGDLVHRRFQITRLQHFEVKHVIPDNTSSFPRKRSRIQQSSPPLHLHTPFPHLPSDLPLATHRLPQVLRCLPQPASQFPQRNTPQLQPNTQPTCGRADRTSGNDLACCGTDQHLSGIQHNICRINLTTSRTVRSPA